MKSIHSKRTDFFIALEEHTMKIHYIPRIERGIPQMYEIVDQYAVAVAIDPNIVTEAKEVFATVERTG